MWQKAVLLAFALWCVLFSLFVLWLVQTPRCVEGTIEGPVNWPRRTTCTRWDLLVEPARAAVSRGLSKG